MGLNEGSDHLASTTMWLTSAAVGFLVRPGGGIDLSDITSSVHDYTYVTIKTLLCLKFIMHAIVSYVVQCGMMWSDVVLCGPMR